jgi:hypothetical protein
MGFDWWREDNSAHTPRPRRISVDQIQDRLRSEQATAAGARLRAITSGPHAAPAASLNLSQAHLTMRQHRNCRIGACPRKHAAWQVLVHAGAITPRSRRTSREP